MINLSKLIFILIILNFLFPSLRCLIDIDSCEVNCTWLFASLIISLKMNICILFNIPYIQYICNICTVCIYICIYMHRYIYIYIYFFFLTKTLGYWTKYFPSYWTHLLFQIGKSLRNKQSYRK